MSCPTQAKTFSLESYSRSTEDIEMPKAGYVLVKVRTAVLHPDGCGIEGIGTVIKSGITSWRLERAKVKYLQTDPSAKEKISNYTICLAKTCAIYKTADIYLYNPLTSLMIKEAIALNRHTRVVHATTDKVLSNMVRKTCSYFEILCEDVNNDNAAKVISQLNPTVLLIGSGEFDCNFFNQMLAGAELIVYRDSADLSGINPSEIIFQGKSIKGLNFSKWFEGLGMKHRYENLYFVENHGEIFKEDLKITSFSEINDGIDLCEERKILSISEFFSENLENQNCYNEDEEKENIEEKEFFEVNEEETMSPGIMGKTTVSYEISSLEESKTIQESPNENSDPNLLVIDETTSSEEIIQNSEKSQDLETQSLFEIISQYEIPAVSQIFSKFPPIAQMSHPDEEIILTFSIKLLQDQSVYEGSLNQFKQPHGLGKRFYQDGSIFNGYWEFGTTSGYGQYISSDLDIYIGEWAHGIYNGFGKSIKSNGDFIEGTFKNGIIQGTGIEVSCGSHYKGEFVDGKKHGKGLLKMNKNLEYFGEFSNGEMNGNAQVKYFDKSFCGCFNGIFAEGVMTYQDGGKFYGKIVDFIEEGEGLFEINGVTQKCVMEAGVLTYIQEDSKSDN